MFKLANQVLDQYDDVLKEGLLKLAQIDPSVYIMTPDEHMRLGDDSFALSVITKKASRLNRFPVEGPNNTWLSNHYFEMNHAKLASKAASIAAYHIKQACERFGIEPLPAVDALAKEASSNVYYEEEVAQAPAQSVQADFSKFAEVEQIGNNYTYAQYVFATPKHVKVAAKYFDEKHTQMPIEYRHKYAAAIQKRCNELGMQPEKGSISKYASDAYSAHLDAHISSRLSLLEFSNPAVAQMLTKLGSMKKEIAPDQFAQALHALDKKAGLTQHYGGYITDPYLSTFGTRTKTASGALSSDEVMKVATDKYAKIKEYFGPQVADELKKHGNAIFDSLPKDAQETIVGIANGSL